MTRQNEWKQDIAEDIGLKFSAKHSWFKDVRTKTFYNTDFFILWLQLDNELPMSEMEKNWGVTDSVFEIKHVKNYPNFDKSALVTRHGLSAC